MTQTAAHTPTPECMIAIGRDGVMHAAAVVGYHEEAVADWAKDDNIAQILRVPVEVPRQLLFEQWPGLDAALALLAKATGAAS
jgi:hypothetical protein